MSSNANQSYYHLLLWQILTASQFTYALPLDSEFSGTYHVTRGSNDGFASSPMARDVKKKKPIAAVVVGSIAIAIVFFLTIFVGFGIYKQCLVRREQRDQTNYPLARYLRTRQAERDAKWSATKAKTRASWFSRSTRQLFRRESNDCDEVDYSKHIKSEALEVDPRVKVPVPPKAAKLLGLEAGGRVPPRLSLSLSLTTVHEEHGSEADLIQPERRRESSECTMSTLGMELLEDTMREPRPERFMSQRVSNETASEGPGNLDQPGTFGQRSRGRGTKYFVPVLGEEGASGDMT